MKKLLIPLLFLFLTSGITAQEIKWMSMNEALAAQQKEPKKIFMDAYTTWCGPCKMLDRDTFSNKDVIAYINKNFYPVKFNAEGAETVNFREHSFTNPGHDPARKGRNTPHQFAQAMQISGYPSLVFFDEQGELIQVLIGFRKPRELEIFLKAFAEDEHKNFQSAEDWNEYQKEFRNEFAK